MRDDQERLRDISEAIERIEKYASRGREAFAQHDWIQVWVVHHLQLIGEAVRGLSVGFRDRYREIPWQKIIGMRHILVHQYFEIDLDLVWGGVRARFAATQARRATGIVKRLHPRRRAAASPRRRSARLYAAPR